MMVFQFSGIETKARQLFYLKFRALWKSFSTSLSAAVGLVCGAPVGAAVSSGKAEAN
jgi:hypothetical protein